MNWELMLQIALTIVASLGGGSAIVLAITKWCSNLLSQKLLGDIQNKHEKEIEQYKANLQAASAKVDAFLQNSVHIVQHQYDMEIGIYKEIWSSLHELMICLDYANDFENLTAENEKAQKQLQNMHFEELREKLKNYKKNVNENAPFYQKEAYELLIKIEEQFQILMNNFYECKDIIIAPEMNNVININKDTCRKIKELNENLRDSLRLYLDSLENFM